MNLYKILGLINGLLGVILLWFCLMSGKGDPATIGIYGIGMLMTGYSCLNISKEKRQK